MSWLAALSSPRDSLVSSSLSSIRLQCYLVTIIIQITAASLLLQPVEIPEQVVDQEQNLLKGESVDGVSFLAALDYVVDERFKVGQQVRQSIFEDVAHDSAEAEDVKERMLLVLSSSVRECYAFIVGVIVLRRSEQPCLLDGEVVRAYAVDRAAGAEVYEFGDSLWADHDVVGFDVAVAGVVVGEPVERSCDGLHERQLFPEGEVLALTVQHFSEVVRIVLHQDCLHLLSLLLVFPVVSRNVPATLLLYIDNEIQFVLKGVDCFLLVRVLDDLLHHLQLLLHLQHLRTDQWKASSCLHLLQLLVDLDVQRYHYDHLVPAQCQSAVRARSFLLHHAALLDDLDAEDVLLLLLLLLRAQLVAVEPLRVRDEVRLLSLLQEAILGHHYLECVLDLLVRLRTRIFQLLLDFLNSKQPCSFLNPTVVLVLLLDLVETTQQQQFIAFFEEQLCSFGDIVLLQDKIPLEEGLESGQQPADRIWKLLKRGFDEPPHEFEVDKVFECEDGAHLYEVELGDEVAHGFVLVAVAIVNDPQQVDEAPLCFDAQTAGDCVCQVGPNEHLHAALERLKPPHNLNAAL